VRACLLAVAIVGIVASAAHVGLTQTVSPAAGPSLEGVWRGTISVTTGANASSNPKRLPNVIIYTKRHYSVLSQDASVPLQPRQAIDPPKDANSLTVAEKLARYELWLPVIATSGEYELNGTMLTHRPVIAKGTATDQTFEIEFQGKDTFVQISKSGLGQPASVTRRTFVRIE
jgi:hypothetical protein